MSIRRSARPRDLPLLAALVAVATSLPARGQPAAPPSAGPADARELEAFFDGLLSDLMADRHAPAAVTHTGTVLEQLSYLALLLAAGFVAVFVWYWNLLGVIR